MVMVHPLVEPKACWEFEGDILILHHPTTISVKYQAMGKCLSSSSSFVASVLCVLELVLRAFVVFNCAHV